MIAPDDRLDSWKAIADYLGRDRRTLMRWERAAGLPIRRIGGGRKGSVFAYKSEIDQWLIGRPVDTDGLPATAERDTSEAVGDRRRIGWVHALAAAAILLAVVLTVAAMTGKIGRAPALITNAAMDHRELVAYDSGGREIWRRQMWWNGRVVSTATLVVGDIDTNGRPDVVGAGQVDADDGTEGDGQLFLVDDARRLRWQRKLDGRYKFGDVEYGPGWFAEDILVYRTSAGVRIAVAQHHHTWWPSLVSTFDADGKRVGTYVNAGWIRRLKLTPDGKYILAAGLSNAHGGPMLAAIDAEHPSGVSPADGGTLPACLNCPAGAPARFFVVPWSIFARPADTPWVTVTVAKDGSIEWRAPQRADASGKDPETIVTLSPTLDVRQRNVDDYFVGLHDQLERAGQLSERNPDWRHPMVREWTPDRGWREIK